MIDLDTKTSYDLCARSACFTYSVLPFSLTASSSIPQSAHQYTVKPSCSKLHNTLFFQQFSFLI